MFFQNTKKQKEWYTFATILHRTPPRLFRIQSFFYIKYSSLCLSRQLVLLLIFVLFMNK